MLKDRYSYVAIFSYEEDGISIDFPDLPGCCPCAEKDDTNMALKNASYWKFLCRQFVSGLIINL